MLKRMVQSDMLNIFRKDSSEELESRIDAATDLPGSTESALPALDQTDLTSTQTPVQEVGDKDSLPVDKKTS
jgi:sorbitol-specific phosphotransferase system component IIA